MSDRNWRKKLMINKGKPVQEPPESELCDQLADYSGVNPEHVIQQPKRYDRVHGIEKPKKPDKPKLVYSKT